VAAKKEGKNAEEEICSNHPVGMISVKKGRLKPHSQRRIHPRGMISVKKGRLKPLLSLNSYSLAGTRFRKLFCQSATSEKGRRLLESGALPGSATSA